MSTTTVVLRLPADTAAALKAQAEADGRSRNKQATRYIRKGLREDGALPTVREGK